MSIIEILLLLIVLCLLCSCIPMLFRKNKDIDGYSDKDDDFMQPQLLNNILTKQECDAIITASRDKLHQSSILSGPDLKIRNSRQAWIERDDPLVANLFAKISDIFKIPIENAESLQVVNYQPGQYYNEHHDSCCDEGDVCNKFVNEGGQRIITVLIYLNNDFADGETYFKNLNMKYKPAVGDAVVFYPLAKGTNKCHIKALHAGLPISSGEKWVANVWYRQRKFR